MLTLYINCIEETGHHVEAHGMWHMILLNDCGIGQIEQRQFCENRANFRDSHP